MPSITRFGKQRTNDRRALGHCFVYPSANAFQQGWDIEEIVWSGNANLVGQTVEIGRKGDDAFARNEGEHCNPRCREIEWQVVEYTVRLRDAGHQLGKAAGGALE